MTTKINDHDPAHAPATPDHVPAPAPARVPAPAPSKSQRDREIDERRAPRARSQGGAECHNGGRPRVPIDESELEAALVAGKSHAEIADLFDCGVRTLRRRLAEIRRARGRGWPVAAVLSKPVATPPPPLPRHLTAEQGESLALRRLAWEADHAAESRDRITAAKALLSAQTGEAPPKFATPRPTLLEDLAQVVEASRGEPPEDTPTPTHTHTHAPTTDESASVAEAVYEPIELPTVAEPLIARGDALPN